ncbi:hypothetical protein BOX15_Mlig034193g1 [Macrostomum lignano]|uniref:Uncharacterized protein n=1 Tax=Macrostomum lignano TaxID=282301 RepID=A0A267DMF4_9PLAT|nr:hypothetical protein BOX15_Mlig012429g1 [Macrostomum lignano]PAA52084.1 hypothetical protein BOX15_Mlig034193g1 [Macrostomum lignano]
MNNEGHSSAESILIPVYSIVQCSNCNTAQLVQTVLRNVNWTCCACNATSVLCSSTSTPPIARPCQTFSTSLSVASILSNIESVNVSSISGALDSIQEVLQSGVGKLYSLIAQLETGADPKLVVEAFRSYYREGLFERLVGLLANNNNCYVVDSESHEVPLSLSLFNQPQAPVATTQDLPVPPLAITQTWRLATPTPIVQVDKSDMTTKSTISITKQRPKRRNLLPTSRKNSTASANKKPLMSLDLTEEDDSDCE